MAVIEGSCGFEHEAFFYDSDARYLAALLPYLHDGLDDGDVVVVVVPVDKIDLLTDALHDRAEGVTFIDAAEWYQHPATTIAGYHDVLCESGGRRTRVIGEVQFGDTAASHADWSRYEAALNRAFTTHDARVVCPYDITLLSTEVVADARRTHPLVLEASGSTSSVHYVEPEQYVAGLTFELHLPDTDPGVDIVVDDDLRGIRSAFGALVSHAVGEDRAAELTLGLNEIITNALVHGDGDVRVRVWAVTNGDIVCTIDDQGTGAADPLLGFVPADHGASRGRGVWMARRLFDRVELSGNADGFRVTLVSAGAPTT